MRGLPNPKQRDCEQQAHGKGLQGEGCERGPSPTSREVPGAFECVEHKVRPPERAPLSVQTPAVGDLIHAWREKLLIKVCYHGGIGKGPSQRKRPRLHAALRHLFETSELPGAVLLLLRSRAGRCSWFGRRFHGPGRRATR